MEKPMKTNRTFTAFLLLFITAALVVSQVRTTHAAPMKVSVAKVQGMVQVNDGSGWKTLKDGDKVASGAEIKTGAGASCMLKWAGGNVVKVGPLTNLTVTADKSGGNEKSTVNLKNGKMTAHAKKLGTPGSTFEVKTPTAVAGVRGTDILAEIAAGNVSFGVADGQLEMTVGGQTFVLDDGFLVEVDPTGGFSEPIPIPAEMLSDLKEEFEALKEEAAQDAESSDADSGDDSKDDSEEDTETEANDDAGDGLDDVIGSIDEILDNEVNADIVDSASGEYITGDVEIIIYVDPVK